MLQHPWIRYVQENQWMDQSVLESVLNRSVEWETWFAMSYPIKMLFLCVHLNCKNKKRKKKPWKPFKARKMMMLKKHFFSKKLFNNFWKIHFQCLTWKFCNFHFQGRLCDNYAGLNCFINICYPYPCSVRRVPLGSSSQSDKHLCGAHSDSCRSYHCCHILTSCGAYSSAKKQSAKGMNVKWNQREFVIQIYYLDISLRKSNYPTLTSMHRQLGSPFSLTAHSLPAPQNTLAHTLLLVCTSCKAKEVCDGWTQGGAVVLFKQNAPIKSNRNLHMGSKTQIFNFHNKPCGTKLMSQIKRSFRPINWQESVPWWHPRWKLTDLAPHSV